MEPASIQLPFLFDTERLKEDLKKLNEDDWLLHYNKRDYEGDWHIIALRSVEGNKYRIFPDYEPVNEVRNTEYLERCSYFKEVLDALPCEKNTVRLMRLSPGARIKEHSDYNLSVNNIELRLHIPIVTNPQMEFYLNKERVYLKEGECWYLNFNLLHSLYNGGTEARVHMVIDCMVNDWLREFFSSAQHAN